MEEEPTRTAPTFVGLFKRLHIVTIPEEFLDKGAPPVTLRFSQLNAKKMAKANMNDTLNSIDRQNEIFGRLSEDQRKVSLERQSTTDAESAKRVQERADEPDTFDDFDKCTLVELAHVQHQPVPGLKEDWVGLTGSEIEDLLCLEWLAGEIYDVSKPKSAKEREKNS